MVMADIWTERVISFLVGFGFVAFVAVLAGVGQ
jgi:hypothetical protein